MLQRIVDDFTLKRQYDIKKKKKNRRDFEKCLKIFHLENLFLLRSAQSCLVS